MNYTIKVINPQMDFKTNQQRKDTYGNPKWTVTVTDEAGTEHVFNKGWKSPRSVGDVLKGRVEEKTGDYGSYKQFVEDKEPFQGKGGGNFQPRNDEAIANQVCLKASVEILNALIGVKAVGKDADVAELIKLQNSIYIAQKRILAGGAPTASTATINQALTEAVQAPVVSEQQTTIDETIQEHPSDSPQDEEIDLANLPF